MHLIYKGAEAELYRSKYLGLDSVEKVRTPKTYRIREIDEKIRMTRTKTEVYNILKASKFISVPRVFDINLQEAKITMQFIDGEKLKDYFFTCKAPEIEKISKKIGESVFQMHKNNIVHGDLTTSNMILKDGEVYFVDFGLAKSSNKVEDKAIDISVFRKMLLSTHYKVFELIWKSFLKGYKDSEVLKQLLAVEKRGRYISREAL